MQGWNFPSNGNGRFDGFHDAAIDHFTDDRLGSFIREVIQNSLDACLDESKPVMVSFRLDSLANQKTPEIFGLVPWLRLAESSSTAGDDPNSVSKAKAKEATFFATVAKDLERSDDIEILSIHDTNTRGLSGPLVGPAGSWFALTKGTGVNEKHSGGSLGSFGHGSKAPFAMTKLRTVFYYTRIPDSDKLYAGEERFQGKSILRSMVNPDGTYTSGTGFFGTGDNCYPVIGNEIPDWIKSLRDKSGFNSGTTLAIPIPILPNNERTWHEATIAVLASFYYAIKKGALEVHLQDQIINAKNLAEIFEFHRVFLDDLELLNSDGIRSRIYSVETIHNPTEYGVLKSPTFGKVDYFIRTAPEIQWKKVGIARKSGMLITRDADKFRRFSNNKNFDLFICVGEEPGNDILRSMENPRHDSFSSDRIEDENERASAQRAYSRFADEVRDLLAQLAPLVVEETAIIDDLDDLLKLPDSDENLGSSGDEASTRPKISGVRTTHPSRILKPKKGKTRTGSETKKKPGSRGVRPTWTSGKLFDSDGSAVIVSDWKGVTQAQSLRIAPKGAERGKVTVYLTVEDPGRYSLELYKAGESENQLIAIKEPQTKEFEITEINQRKKLELEIDSRDLAFAMEGLIRVIS